MSLIEIQKDLAPLFEGRKFKGLQTVHFFYKECIEIGVIHEVKEHLGSSQASYVITFLDDSYKLANVEIEEEDIFNSYEEIAEFAKDIFSPADYRCTLKHFQKTQFLKEGFQEGLPLDEYIFQPVIK